MLKKSLSRPCDKNESIILGFLCIVWWILWLWWKNKEHISLFSSPCHTFASIFLKCVTKIQMLYKPARNINSSGDCTCNVQHLSHAKVHMRGFRPLLRGRLLQLLGASTQLAICSNESPCSIAISSWPSRKVVRTRSEHSSQSAHTLHYVRTHPGTIAERNLISAKLARLCGDR
jgi:hypothetical protein